MDDHSTRSTAARQLGVLSATLVGLVLAGAVTGSLSVLLSAVEALFGLGAATILLQAVVESSDESGASTRALVAAYAAVVVTGGLMAVYAPVAYAVVTWAISWTLVLFAAHRSGRPAVLADWVGSVSNRESTR